MDLNAILFENNGYQYKIYDEYYATDNEKKIGIQVTNTKTGKISNLKQVQLFYWWMEYMWTSKLHR